MKTPILISLLCGLLFVGSGKAEDDVAPLYKEGFVATFGQFRTMPQTREEAEAAGWEFDGSDSDCGNGGKFNGFRYYEPNSIAITAIYDKNNQIAGFQSIFPNNVFEGSSYRYKEISMIQPTEINGVPYWQITIYIKDPKDICREDAPSRNLAEVIDFNVFYQNGPSTNDLVNLPRNRPKAEQVGWDSFGCFPQMGYHSLYHSDDFGESHCTKFDPTLALYDTKTGTLIGCGVWIYARSEDTSDRFEKPPPAVVEKIVGEKFDPCILKDVTTSLHMYFVDDPASITCGDA